MMAVLSHELKSPLHGILGLSNSLLDDDDMPFQVGVLDGFSRFSPELRIFFLKLLF